jgi:cell division protein FtsL
MSYQIAQNYCVRRRQNWSRNQNTVAYVSAIKLGPVTHTVLIALMVVVLGLIYLTQATRATSYDYAAQRIDRQIAELNAEKSDLEIENARLTSLETIKTSSVASTMTQPVTTEYAQ